MPDESLLWASFGLPFGNDSPTDLGGSHRLTESACRSVTIPRMNTDRKTMGRRAFLRTSVQTSTGIAAGSAAMNWLSLPAATAAPPAAAIEAFVGDYLTNTTDNLSADSNAAVRILSGMYDFWKTGPTWDTGIVLEPETLRANMRYCATITQTRTEEEGKRSFITDRQHQSYSALGGLGPFADLYKVGAKAVTSITTAPDGTPPERISDAVPEDAPVGSETGAGSVDSELGLVVELVNTVRGPHASSNPSKYTYQYPRPWRLNEDSQVVDTGRIDELGFPVYESDVIVVPQLLRQRGETPDTDGGYPSGHANASYLATLALAHAIPERFQELMVQACDVSHDRIVSGMHSPVDTVGGRILATALAAAVLHDPQYAELRAGARSQARQYFIDKTGATADTLYAAAHQAGTDTDPYDDRVANKKKFTPRLTYVFSRQRSLSKQRNHEQMVVPKGAEALLETRLPYLTAEQRREVLRTTALPSGYVLLDGPEQWGRLNLFAAADCYGAFDDDVTVEMDAAEQGFHNADAWRNDISGRGGLTKTGTGSLTLTGSNRYAGGTRVEAGTLVAGSATAFGHGDVQVSGGTLSIDPIACSVEIPGHYAQKSDAVLEVTLGAGPSPVLAVGRTATLGSKSILEIHLPDGYSKSGAKPIPVISSRRLSGTFGTITVLADGYRAEPVYTADGLSIRLVRD